MEKDKKRENKKSLMVRNSTAEFLIFTFQARESRAHRDEMKIADGRKNII